MGKYEQSGPTTFKDLVEPLPESMCEVATQIRAIIKATMPEADEAVSGGAKMGMALYSINGANNVICGIQPTENMCKLFFHGWKRLEKAGYRMEGSGKHARHIRIRSSRELAPEEVAQMIKVARKSTQNITEGDNGE